MIPVIEKAEGLSENVCFIKNKGEFYFEVNQKNQISGSEHFTGISSCGKVKVFVDGIIYNFNSRQLADGFAREGTALAKKLDGSFVIFLISEGELYLITDRVNSKKIYYGLVDGSWYISNNIDVLPIQKCTLSFQGLACYLANGSMLNNLTIFSEIKSAGRAAILKVTGNGVKDHCYYPINYRYPEPKADEFYEEELEKLLYDCIKSRTAAAGKTAVSLSGGHDARTILAVMKHLKVPDVFSFSYSLPQNKRENSDSFLAKKIAAICGYEHEIIDSYKGNLIEHIAANAREGKCLSHMCEELHTWHYLSEKKITDVFCGDEIFGYFDVSLNSKEQLLGIIAISGASGLAWLKKFTDKSVYSSLYSNLETLNEEIFQKTNTNTDPHDKKDFLYIDQRLNHVLMPWRENICSQAGFIHNPLLDNKILDFMLTVPPHLRKEKILFKRTINKIFPEVFGLGLARVSGYNINWQIELQKNKTELIAFVNNTESRLDTIIPREAVIKMIQSQGTVYEQVRKGFVRIVLYARKKSRFLDKVLNPIIGPMLNPKGQPVFPDQLLLRILLLRTYLKK